MRGGYVAELVTNYVDTTDMCMELFFWSVASVDSLYKPLVSIATVTESGKEFTQATSTGYELETWNVLFARLPAGIHRLIVRGARSNHGLCGISIDDIVVQPCAKFGKTPRNFSR